MRLQEFSSWTPKVWSPAPIRRMESKLQSVCGRFNPFGREECGVVNGDAVLRDAAGMGAVQVATDVEMVRREQNDIRLDYGEYFFPLTITNTTYPPKSVYSPTGRYRRGESAAEGGAHSQCLKGANLVCRHHIGVRAASRSARNATEGLIMPYAADERWLS